LLTFTYAIRAGIQSVFGSDPVASEAAEVDQIEEHGKGYTKV
jgi:hypothetical protein